jgi:uncharacterized protein
MKSKYDSFYINDIAEGCKFCLRGEKLVLFMGGKCSRSCWYCSLSDSRKKCKILFANERPILKKKDLIEEVKASGAKGAGITGGDPLVQYKKTLKFAKILKKKFSKDFHIHIYLPLNLVTLKNISELSKYIDEFRFHPSFLIYKDKIIRREEINKIITMSTIIGKDRIGIELPLLPEKKEMIIDYINDIKDYISFLNLNQFEISETNFNKVTKKYKINEDSYTIAHSKEIGLKILHHFKDSSLKIHLCTAKTKDKHQYIKRLNNYKILPFGNRTEDGNVIYFAYYPKEIKKALKKIKKISSNFFIDKPIKRIIIKMQDVEKVYRNTGLKIARVMEPPTYNADYLEFSYIDE